MIFDALRVLIPFVLSFAIGIALAPLLAHYLYKHKAWKKQSGKTKGMGDETGTPIFNKMHETHEVRAPRMGGVLIWGSTFITALLLIVLSYFFNSTFTLLDFVNREQTWLPLFALFIGAGIGLIDDFLEITRSSGGLALPWRLSVVALLGAFAGWWFYEKLEISSIGIPFVGPLELGIFFIPFFILVTIALYASGVIDGLDGLAGGVFAIIFMAYAGIAFAQEQIALSAFASTLSGGIFAFLWFNVPPARFYLSETGSMALTLALSVTAFSADVLGEGVGVSVLPIIAIVLTVTVLTSALQVLSKKFFKKKIFIVAPIHHHFEALGWPSEKVVMRYWIITIIASMFGLALALLK